VSLRPIGQILSEHLSESRCRPRATPRTVPRVPLTTDLGHHHDGDPLRPSAAAGVPRSTAQAEADLRARVAKGLIKRGGLGSVGVAVEGEQLRLDLDERAA
jgi:hypothetical protein